MLNCLRRLAASSSQNIGAVRVLARRATTSELTPNKVVKPYPLPDVYVGKINGVQVDHLQRPKEGEALIDKIHALPTMGAYVFDYKHLKDELDHMHQGTRMCFQLKYLSKDRQTYNLTQYLQEELKKTQNPLNVQANEMEFKVAKYALHYKNIHAHIARSPHDRKIKATARINRAALLDAQKILMKLDFARYDYLMNELRMDPPIDIVKRGAHHSRGKPRDMMKSMLFIRKHRLRELKKVELEQAALQAKKTSDTKTRYHAMLAAEAADGIVQADPE